jgi:glycosyltransferase involved in cell wall biosynthesis
MSDNHQRFISVIIPVFNNIEALIICLQALENQTYPPNLYEVIVVDNGFDDNLEDLITQFKQARFTSESRPGSYAARNQGIAIAKGEILAFTDSDCIPNQDWLANGIKYLLSVPNCGLVAGKINFFYQNPQSPTAIEIYDSVTFLDQKKYIEKHHYGATANLFTFKKVFEKVGFFNCNLKSGGDKEWGKRVFSHGYSCQPSSESFF